MGMKLSEWRLKATDAASAVMAKVGGAGAKMAQQMGAAQRSLMGANRPAVDLSGSLDTLRTRMQQIINLKDMVDGHDINQIKVYNQQITALNKQINRLDGAKFGGMKQGLTDALSYIPGLGGMGAAMTNPYVAAAAGIALVGGIALKSVDMARQFDEGMAKVNTTAQLTRPALNALRADFIALGMDSTSDIKLIPDAFAKINDQVNDTALAMDILKISLKGSEAGFADVNVVGDALAKVLSIVGKEKTNAQEVMDTLFAAKRAGAGEFEDFARYVPGLIASGNALGVGFKETAGLFGFMTGKGQEASQAATLIQNAFTALGKKEITSGMEKFGVAIFDANRNLLPMEKIIINLQKRMEGLNDEAKSNLLENMGLRDAQAKQAFSILTSDIQKLQETLGATAKPAGELNAALENSANLSQSTARFWNAIEGIQIDAGSGGLPQLATAMDMITKGLQDNYKVIKLMFSMQDTMWKTFSTGVVDVGEKMFGKISHWGNVFKSVIANAAGGVGSFFSMIGSGVSLDMKGMQAAWADTKRQFGSMGDVAPATALSSGGAMVKTPDVVANSMGFLKRQQGNGQGMLLAANTAGNMFGGGGTGETSQDEATYTKGLETVSSGGPQVRNVTVTFGSLIENLSITPANLREGVDEIERMIEERLIRIIQGAEIASS